MSGLDLARGLIRSGYRMKGSASGYLLLERGARAVTVPIEDDLEPELLRFLATAAGVLPPQLVAALQAPAPIELMQPLVRSRRAAATRQTLSGH